MCLRSHLNNSDCPSIGSYRWSSCGLYRGLFRWTPAKKILPCYYTSNFTFSKGRKRYESRHRMHWNLPSRKQVLISFVTDPLLISQAIASGSFTAEIEIAWHFVPRKHNFKTSFSMYPASRVHLSLPSNVSKRKKPTFGYSHRFSARFGRSCFAAKGLWHGCMLSLSTSFLNWAAVLLHDPKLFLNKLCIVSASLVFKLTFSAVIMVTSTLG